MNLKFLLIPLLLMSYTPTTHADEGLDISYKVPFLPLEIVFDSDGISFHGTKTIVTPIGSFSLGYSKYASKFEEDYTYVIIEDMNLKKEHIYKINDKKKLLLQKTGYVLQLKKEANLQFSFLLLERMSLNKVLLQAVSG